MYKYIIVDDEPLIRMGTLNKLESLGSLLCCVGEAGNGVQTIGLVKEMQPDIIILDMEMPIMDGTQLLPYLTENHPGIHLIVISAYKSFDYIKYALSANVIDYVLKPFSEEQIQEIVLRAVSRIKDSQTIESRLRINTEQKELAYYENDLVQIQNLILGYNDTAVELHSDRLRFIRQTSYYTLAMAYLVGNTPFNSLHLPKHLVELGFSELVLFVSHPSNSKIGFFILCATADSFQLHHSRKSRDIICALTNHIQTYQELSYWGISDAVTSLGQLHTAYKQACNILNQIPCSTHTSWCCWQQQNHLDGNTIIDWDKSEEFLFRIETGMTEQVHLLYQNLVEFYQTAPNLTIADVKQHNHRLLEDCLLFMKYYVTHCVTSQSMAKNIREIFSLDELLHFYENYFSNLSNMLKPQSVYAIDDTIEQIRIYTQRNFQKNISIELLASLFFLNSSYLSHIFKKKTGVKYIQYLNTIRIDKAKELLTSSERKLYQIARTVGFEDPKYFIRVFKKMVGITPEQYRKKIHD